MSFTVKSEIPVRIPKKSSPLCYTTRPAPQQDWGIWLCFCTRVFPFTSDSDRIICFNFVYLDCYLRKGAERRTLSIFFHGPARWCSSRASPLQGFRYLNPKEHIYLYLFHIYICIGDETVTFQSLLRIITPIARVFTFFTALFKVK